jgi:TetR/AcrR family transcriptional repressor of nem operon
MEKNTRNDLINCTFDEIYTKGYQGASLTNILKNAKVHKGSMYHF